MSWLAYTNETEAIGALRSTQQAIAMLPPAALKNAAMGKTLTNKLNAAILQVQAGNYAGALDQLENDVLQKTNGCANGAPPAPDANDWVRTCAEQAKIYPLVVDAIAKVISLL